MFATLSGDFNIAELCTAVFTGILALFALVGAARALMPNEPVDLDEINTNPETQATIPSVADLMSARARAWVYLVIALASPAYAIYESSSEAPVAVTALWASVTALGSLLAVANVPRTVNRAR